jgi:hypothetical protein
VATEDVATPGARRDEGPSQDEGLAEINAKIEELKKLQEEHDRNRTLWEQSKESVRPHTSLSYS